MTLVAVVRLTLRKWSVPACCLTDRQSLSIAYTRTHTHITLLHRLTSILHKQEPTCTNTGIHILNTQHIHTHTLTTLAVAGPDPWDWLSLKVGLRKYSPLCSAHLTSAQRCTHANKHTHSHTHTQSPCVHVSPHTLPLQGISCGYSCVPTGIGSQRHNREKRI